MDPHQLMNRPNFLEVARNKWVWYPVTWHNGMLVISVEELKGIFIYLMSQFSVSINLPAIATWQKV